MRRNVPSTAAGRPSKVQVARGTGKDMPKSRAAKAASSEGFAMVNGTGCIECVGLSRTGRTDEISIDNFLASIGEPSRRRAVALHCCRFKESRG